MKKKGLFLLTLLLICGVAVFALAACASSGEDTKDTVRVTYTDGGSAVAYSDVEKDAKVTRPVDPTKTGYNFDDWYTSKEFTESGKWSFTENAVTENTTLYAKWTATVYGITYNANGGSGAANATYTIESGTITLPTAATFTKTGYTFGGWFVSGDFSGGAVTAIATGSTGEKTFYAKWTVDDYGISYNLDGGTNNAANLASYTIESDTVTLSEPTKEGYTFVEWLPSGTIVKGSTGNKTFTANWVTTEYGISYNLDGGTNNAANPSSYTIESDTITLSAPTKDGYSFVEWQPGDTIAKGSMGAKTFTAAWLQATAGLGYTLTDNGEGYSVSKGTANITGYVIFPDSYNGLPVTAIADNEFNSLGTLVSITLPSGLTTIGDGAFAYCGSLESITLPSGLTTIGDNAFEYCGSLTSITIPSNVTTIGETAFYNCSGLKSIMVEGNSTAYKSIDGVLFSKDGKTLLVYPIGITDTTYTIPSGVTTIEDKAFAYCSSLASIVIPSGVTAIGDYAFYNCSNLTIYAEATSAPSGWSSYWNYSNYLVYWGGTWHVDLSTGLPVAN